MGSIVKRKVGIMGGTFDPIHMGHLLLAECAWQEFSLDQVLFIPSGHSYFKDHREMKVTGPEHRLAMTRLAVSDNPHFAVSEMEILRPGRTYICDTLGELREQNPDTEYYFIVGADTIASMADWYHPERVFASCTVLAAMRPDETPNRELQQHITSLQQQFGARIEILHAPCVTISSTMLRQAYLAGESTRYRIPEEVHRYIKENNLYI